MALFEEREYFSIKRGVFRQERTQFFRRKNTHNSGLEKSRFWEKRDFHERKQLKIKFHLNTCNVSILYFDFLEYYEYLNPQMLGGVLDLNL